MSYNGAAIGSATIGATASGVAAANVTAATLSPQGAARRRPGFVDWTTYGFDNHRDGFNPSSTAFTPSALGGLHLAWQTLGYGDDYSTQSQPILATNLASHAGLLFVGGALGRMYALRRAHRRGGLAQPARQRAIPCGTGGSFQFGIGGTAAYDPARARSTSPTT